MNFYEKQYYDKGLCEKFSNNLIPKTQNRQKIFSLLNPDLSGQNVLDIGCGSGADLQELMNRGAKGYGIDASECMLDLAKKTAPSAVYVHGNFTALPYDNALFNIVFSKYSLYHVSNLDVVYREIFRVLKPGGCFVFLTTHPIREFMEGDKKNYLEQGEFATTIFEGKVTLKGYTHTFRDYISNYLISNFKIEHLEEENDPTHCVRISDVLYPGYLLVKARKLVC